MNSVILVFAAGCAFVQPSENPRRIANIYIEGNTDTPAGVIRNHLDLRSGQRFDPAALAQAEMRLRASGLFKSNPWRGTGAVVIAVPNDFDSEFVDVLVRVEERPGNWLPFGLMEVTWAALQLDWIRAIYYFGMLCRQAAEAFERR
jgi:hypothetical protein